MLPRPYVFRLWLLLCTVLSWAALHLTNGQPVSAAPLAYFAGGMLATHELLCVPRTVFALAGLRSLAHAVLAVLLGSGIAIAGTWAVGLRVQAGLLLTASSAILLGVCAYMLVARIAARRRQKLVAWPSTDRVLIGGVGFLNRELAERLVASPQAPEVAGYLAADPQLAGAQINGVPVLGTAATLAAIDADLPADEIWTATPLDASFAHAPLPMRAVDIDSGADCTDEPRFFASLQALKDALGADATPAPSASTSPQPAQTHPR